MSEETVPQPTDTQPPVVVNGEAKKNDLFNVVQEPPSWLNQDFLEKCLRDYESDKTLLVIRIFCVLISNIIILFFFQI